MSYLVKELEADDKTSYEQFISQKRFKPHVTFMHTYAWGEFMAATSTVCKRIGVYDGSTLVATAQISKKPLRFGGYFWYCPRGLVLDYSSSKLVKQAYESVSNYLRDTGAAFFRADPDILSGSEAEAAIDTLKPHRAAIFSQAERVWCADIQADEQTQFEWLKAHGMAKKIPYYYRKAKKEGVTFRASNDPADLEKLIGGLNDLNSRKGGIGKHQDEYYRKQFSIMAPAGYEKVFLAELNGEMLAGALISLYGREASYLHAASTESHRELWAPRGLLLEVMFYCQQQHPEIERFNFWGVVSDKNRKPSHPRHGYSEFKRSFGGYKEEYMRARDFVYSYPAWRIDWAIQKYRTWKYKND